MKHLIKEYVSFTCEYTFILLFGIPNLLHGKIIATNLEIKILLSSKKWLYRNCQHFLLHWGKTDLFSNLSLMDDIMKKGIFSLKGHCLVWALFKEYRIQDESKPGTFTESTGGRCHLISWIIMGRSPTVIS